MTYDDLARDVVHMVNTVAAVVEGVYPCRPVVGADINNYNGRNGSISKQTIILSV